MEHSNTEREDWRDFAQHFALFDGLRSKSIAVTGATGLLGSCMVNCLLALNDYRSLDLTIVCVVRNRDKAARVLPSSGRVVVVQHDFGSDDALTIDVHVDYLIHFASPTASQYFVSKPAETMLTDFDGTAQMLRFCHENGVQSLVNVSTLEVYGSVYDDAAALTEERQGYIDPMQTRSSYPMAKRAAECLCHAFAEEYGVHVKTVRLAQTFGAGVAKDDDRVFAQFARNVIAGKNIVLHTTGELSRCYCYTTDAIEAILYILLRGEDGAAYNVANEQTYISIVDMARFLCSEFGSGIRPVMELKEGMGYSPMTKLRLSCEKIHRLGWTPRYGLREMFARLIQSMKHA